jgi:antitoxin (DNA-binding transcriptional repressor) of toxin-antitoxin stability system
LTKVGYGRAMSEAIAIGEAKTRRSELVRRVDAGEEFVLRRGSKRVARLVPEPASAIQPPGALRGRIRIAETFDDPLPEFADLRP